MPKKRRSSKRSDWEADAGSRQSEKAATHVPIVLTMPVLPPGAEINSVVGLSLESEVQTLLEDSEGDSMLIASPILTRDECTAWIAWGERIGFALEQHKQTAYIAHRDNGRLAVESDEVAAAIFARLQPWVPAHVAGRKAVGCNNNIRLYRYEKGQRFGPHVDQANQLASGATTEFTVLLYS